MRRFFIVPLLLTAAACSRQPASVKVDATLQTLVPQDTVLLVGTRFEALLKTPIYQKNFANRQIPQIDEFARRTGIDPRKDLWELLFVSNGKEGFLLGRGKFGDEMFQPSLDRPSLENPQLGIERFTYKGMNLYGNDQGAVVLLSGTTAAIGRIDDLHNLIDHRTESHGPPAALTDLMKDLPADAQFWAAYAGGPIHLPFAADSNLGNLNKMIASVQTGSLYFDLRTGINGVLTANCSDDASGEQVEGAFKALIGIGRLSVPKNQPELADVYNTIRVTREGKRVKLYMDVPENMAQKFLDLWMGAVRQ
jgi:hypothetical protein